MVRPLRPYESMDGVGSQWIGGGAASQNAMHKRMLLVIDHEQVRARVCARASACCPHMNSVLLSSPAAAFAASESRVTKPKPRERPVSRSVGAREGGGGGVGAGSGGGAGRGGAAAGGGPGRGGGWRAAGPGRLWAAERGPAARGAKAVRGAGADVRSTCQHGSIALFVKPEAPFVMPEAPWKCSAAPHRWR